ncbi:DMT family transporter [Cryobacterium levicorallinum]|uniref:Transporter family-2 protein n=2 Tax=Cryobacterium levicorallinum TaxID=995038 RepID=A0ABY1EFW7_9MICO|nr:DMT family transporter [Cryobacterium levicorallinum]GEP27516.1 membrane protein [Cryobacterium levicorallinum]SFH70695.1 transporter family-2 protein [Cryobacterium levicorallinum]
MTEDSARTRTDASAAPAASSVPIWLALLFSVLIGAMYAVQSRVNGELGHQIGDGFTAAVISFGSGLVILSLGLVVFRSGRRGLQLVTRAVRAKTLSWWHLFGGLAGALFVLSQGLVAAPLGIALFTVAVVAGQTVSGVLIDRFGIGPGGRRPLHASKIVGAVLALVAVAWTVSGELGGSDALWLLVLPLVAGIGQGWQQAVNGQVRVTAQSALTATFLNFLTGSVALVLAALVHGVLVGFALDLPGNPWLYTGGLIGCIFIAGAALVVRTTGVLMLGLCIVAGQLLCALALDLLAPTQGHPVGVTTLAGTALALVAVVIAAVRWHRPGHART